MAIVPLGHDQDVRRQIMTVLGAGCEDQIKAFKSHNALILMDRSLILWSSKQHVCQQCLFLNSHFMKCITDNYKLADVDWQSAHVDHVFSEIDRVNGYLLSGSSMNAAGEPADGLKHLRWVSDQSLKIRI